LAVADLSLPNAVAEVEFNLLVGERLERRCKLLGRRRGSIGRGRGNAIIGEPLANIFV